MQVGYASGKCSNCGRVYAARHPKMVVCDCYEYCPLCSQKMTDYTPDLAPSTYGLGAVRDLLVYRVCNNVSGHSTNSPFFSVLKPVEVELK